MKSKLVNLIIVFSLLIAAGATAVFLYARVDSEEPGRAEAATKLTGSANPSREFALSAAKPADQTVAKPRNAAERLAESLSSEQQARLLGLINEGTPKDLLKIHGVGKTRAEAIQAARPFVSVAQLAHVNGVGKVTFASVIEYGKQLGKKDAVVAVAAPSVH